MTTGSRPGDRFDSIFLRCFGGFGGNANYVHYWDGMRLPTGVNHNVPSVNPFFIDSIEIMRGPASVLYGSGNPGGLVNLVSKAPQAEAANEIFTRVGNNGWAEAGFDFTGPVGDAEDLLYRLTGVGHLGAGRRHLAHREGQLYPRSERGVVELDAGSWNAAEQSQRPDPL